MKFRNFEGSRIEFEIKFFRTYLKDMEQALEKERINLEREFDVLKKEGDIYQDEDSLIEYLGVVQQYFPIFYSSFVIAIFSFFEYELNRICRILEVKDESNIILKNIYSQGISRAKIFMEKVCHLDLPSENLWEELVNINKVRNCLVHSNGEVSKKDENLMSDIEKLRLIKIETNRITKIKTIKITKEYCSFVIEIIEKYLLTLTDRNVKTRWDKKTEEAI